jgi:hypothetical protein
MTFLSRLRRKRNHDSCEKNPTGTKKTGIWRIPAGITYLAAAVAASAATDDWATIAKLLRRALDWFQSQQL